MLISINIRRKNMAETVLTAIPILIVTLFVILVWTLWRKAQEKKAGFAVVDERTARNEGKAARITVMATGYFMLGLLYYVFVSENFELGLPVLEAAWALIIAVLFNSVMYLGLRWHFERKVDLV